MKWLKRIGWVTFGICVMILCIFIFMDWDIGDGNESSGKQIEIIESRVLGYTNGHVSWEAEAETISVGRSQYIFRVESLKNGRLYRSDGQEAMRDLRAKELRVNSKNKMLSANGNVSAVFLDPGTPSFDAMEIFISGEIFKYFDVSSRAYLSDSVEIRYDDVTILPSDNVEFNIEQQIAEIDGGFRFQSDIFDISGKTMIISINDRYSLMENGVKGFRKKEKRLNEQMDDREQRLRSDDTKFSATTMTYFHDDGENVVIQLIGDVTLDQGRRIMQAERVDYSAASDVFELFGDVQLVTDGLDWLVDSSRKSAFENEELSAAVDKTTTINCGVLLFNTKQRVFAARGGVEVVQDGLYAKATQLIFDDATGELILEGRVFATKDGHDDIRTDRLIVNILEERIKTEGLTNTIFKLKTPLK